MAATIIIQDDKLVQTYVQQLFGNIQNDASSDDDKVKAALTFGEVGSKKDMSQMNGLMQTISRLF
jgi:hypothetical protein